MCTMEQCPRMTNLVPCPPGQICRSLRDNCEEMVHRKVTYEGTSSGTGRGHGWYRSGGLP